MATWTYTLSIEDRVGRGADVTERAVIARLENIQPFYLASERVYNPNAESKKPFNPDGREFDTPFSIVHPFREIAQEILKDCAKYDLDKPKMMYHSSVNDAQRALFETILAQEHEAYTKIETDTLKKESMESIR